MSELQDLRDRLAAAADHLDSLASQQPGYTEEQGRLRGKAEGVRLVISYVDEALRDEATR